jgi:hypothetical protein
MSYRPTIFPLAAFFRLMPSFVKLGTPGFRRLLLKLVPHKSVRRTRDIVDIMDKTSVEIFEQKRRALEQGDQAVLQQVGRGKDIMSILCRSRFSKILLGLVLTSGK